MYALLGTNAGQTHAHSLLSDADTSKTVSILLSLCDVQARSLRSGLGGGSGQEDGLTSVHRSLGRRMERASWVLVSMSDFVVKND